MIILAFLAIAILVYGFSIKWNFRQKLFCPLARKYGWDKLYKKADCKRYEAPATVVRTICLKNPEPGYVLSGPNCKETVEKIFAKGYEPTAYCATCKSIEPEEVVPIDNPLPVGTPLLVCACLGLQYNLERYPVEEVKAFANKLSMMGVRLVRIMGDWESEFTPGPGISAFLRDENGRFNLDRPNEKWDQALLKLKGILEKRHMRIYFDLVDQCDAAKGPWEFNNQGIYSIYDPGLLGRYKEFFDRVFKILGPESRYGLGNEFQGDRRDWLLNVVVPLADYMYDRIEKPLSFSGEPNTAHHIHGLLAPKGSDNPYGSGKFGIRDSCRVQHWMATPSLMIGFMDSVSDVRCYGLSDDGVTMENFNANHGPCVPVGSYCQGTIEQRIAVAKAAWEKWGPHVNKDGTWHENQLDHIEFLPRELSWGENPNTISEESLEIYPRLGQALWGIDVRRRMP